MTRFEQILDELISLVNENYTNELMGMDSALDYEKQASLRKDLIDFARAVVIYAEYQGAMLTSTEEKHYRQALKTIDEMTKEVE